MTGFEGATLAIDLLNITLLTILFVVAIAIARLRSLFAIVMLSGIYSLVSATWFVALDAVDVAFTEAAVGAGISTALFTTLVGLEIAIPAIAAYNVLRNRVSRLLLEVGVTSENLMSRFEDVQPQGAKK